MAGLQLLLMNTRFMQAVKRGEYAESEE
jgi:hypothetical protein